MKLGRLEVERAYTKRVPGDLWVGVFYAEQSWDTHLKRGDRLWNVYVCPLPTLCTLFWVIWRAPTEKEGVSDVE